MKTLILDLVSKTRLLVILGYITFSMSLPVLAQGQNNIVVNGIIQESGTKNPLEFASASLLTVKDSTLVKGAISKTNGGFTFTNVTPGTYKLRLSFVGYSTFRKTITIPESPETQNLGSFQLDQVKSLINEVVITATLPVIVKKDTLDYNADMFKVEKNAVVEDMLKKLPGVEIDGSGKIKSIGSYVYMVFVYCIELLF